MSFVGTYNDPDHSYPSSDEEPEDHSDDDYEDGKNGGSKRKRATTTKRKPKAPPKPTYVARVTETATDPADEGASKVDSADSNVLAKIRKALTLAMHAGTGEAEAKLAMRMATKLMQAQNLTQADLIVNETAEQRATRAGRSIVTITSTAGKVVRTQRWYSVASDASCEAFDVQFYSELLEEGIQIVFYGLADNTVGAAYAFEMLYNQIETWALERKGELKGRTAGNSYRNGAAQRVLNDAIEENHKALKQAEADEKKRRQEQAAAADAARAAEIARLATPTIGNGEPSGESEEKPKVVKIEEVPEEDRIKPLVADLLDNNEDESGENFPPNYDYGANMDNSDDDGDVRADFDDNDETPELDLDALEEKIKVQAKEEPDAKPRKRRGLFPPPHHTPATPAVKAEPLEVKMELPASHPTVKTELVAKKEEEIFSAPVKPEPSDDAAPHWTSALQLRTFRDNAKTIGDAYIKEQGVKIYSGRNRNLKYDLAAFDKGWEDGKKVDLKRRKIEDVTS